MKISASMARLPGLPLPFVAGVALAVQIVGVSERYVPSCGTEQTSAPPRNENLKPKSPPYRGAIQKSPYRGVWSASSGPAATVKRLSFWVQAREVPSAAPLFDREVGHCDYSRSQRRYSDLIRSLRQAG